MGHLIVAVVVFLFIVIIRGLFILLSGTANRNRDSGPTEVYHEGLNKYRVIRDRDPEVVDKKVDAQTRQWDDMWGKRLIEQGKRAERANKATNITEKKEIAVKRTSEAQDSLNQLSIVLSQALTKTSQVNWTVVKDRNPPSDKKPAPANPIQVRREPIETDDKYTPKISFHDQLLVLSSRRAQKEKAAGELFRTDHEAWVNEKSQIEITNKKSEGDYQKSLASWQQRLKKRQSKRQKQLADVKNRKQQYLKLQPEAVRDYCKTVLSNSVYPEWFPKEYDVEYNLETKTIIVEYSLPDVVSVPRVNEVKYVASSNQFKETLLSDSAVNKLYDTIIYQITLRTLHELYEADAADAVGSIVFNGWVTTTDLGTGQRVRVCILSVHCQKEEFRKLKLRDVDPKTCFKKLKGIGSSKLHGIAAIAPILTINREDSRFVQAHGVAHLIDDSVNIAAMEWIEFEHLIREVFEQEFSGIGGEVKITRASRDRGVDAVAFDPDPIRGGKIVIQAKRYTNSVDVAAVRDLYGTVVNEGATKGILVTTSDYGPDSYAFAKDKPLTLLNGSNLLHLLEKHGHKAKIDLAEAKIILSSEKDTA